ncbi:MAG: serine/threonine protein kinase [Bradymonadaceae bacterium]|nr:serine/threonine protein kinase [Lujinxingiaceae bacterium]
MVQTPLAQTAAHDSAVETELPKALLSGRYRVEKCLGEGGMGVVYRAEHVLMKKTVAVKVLHPEMTQNEEVVARFQREAQAAANINHPNVCAATDFGQTEDGAFFLVIEYLEGDTLHTTLSTYHKLTPLRSIHIAQQICSALDQAHEQGIVHRDLKPENIMLVERDDDPDFVKIMDFGIARVSMEKSDGYKTPARLTKAGMVYGTPHYMSPEQVVGGEIDARADLYSVGVVLFEMLTGRLPFESDNLVQLMGMHVTKAPPRPSEVVTGVTIPKALDALVVKLLAKSPEQRHQSAEQVRNELLVIGELLEHSAPNASPGQTLVAAIAPVARQASSFGTPWVQWFKALNFATKAALGGALAAGAFVLGLSFVLSAVAPSPKAQTAAVVRAAQTLSAERESFVEELGLEQALAEAANGDFAKLQAFEEQRPANAHILYLLGIVHANANLWSEALDHYDRAIGLDKRYVHEPRVLDDVFMRFESRTVADATPAEAFLVKHRNHTATLRLEKLAQTGPTHPVRRRAFDTLHKSGEFAKRDAWSRAAMELRAASGCTEHKEKIAQLVSIGDKRSLPALRAVEALPRSGCGFLKRQDCHACFREDIKAAIEKIDR